MRPDVWHCHKWIKCNQIRIGYLTLCVCLIRRSIYALHTTAAYSNNTKVRIPIYGFLARGRRNALFSVFEIRKNKTRAASASTRPVFVQCTQNVCQGMDDGTLRTNMHVVSGLDERREPKHHYYMYISILVCVRVLWPGFPSPVIRHPPSNQRVHNK